MYKMTPYEDKPTVEESNEQLFRKLTWALELANESVKIWKERAEKAEEDLAAGEFPCRAASEVLFRPGRPPLSE